MSSYASAILALASRDGWGSPVVHAWLDTVYTRENPDGGYGLNAPFDAFNDHSINPSSTTYTITLYQVGSMLLEGWRNGAVPRARVEEVLRRLVTMPKADALTPGVCLSYSTQPADAIGCVHNVNAAAGMLLRMAQDAGILGAAEVALADSIALREHATFIATSSGWRYHESMLRLNDCAHASVSALAMRYLAPDLFRTAADAMLSGAYEPCQGSRLNHLNGLIRLLPYYCASAESYLPSVWRALQQGSPHAREYATLALSASEIVTRCGASVE